MFAKLKRLGPGSDAINREMVERLAPAFRKRAPRIVDMGCGTGAAALPLAKALRRPVAALDHEPTFVQALAARAVRVGHRDLILAALGDLAAPPWRPGAFDIVWAEGSAYAIGLERALYAWEPLLDEGGYIVLSEPIWNASRPSKDARDYWAVAYPGMGDGDRLRRAAEKAGLEVIGARNLPPEAWWTEFYKPLVQVAKDMELSATPAGRAVLADLRWEMITVERRLGEFEYAMFLLKKKQGGTA